ncbi:LOW QUALITY PROTEIN: protein arginine N-methyltransferase 2-like [Lethenteron reissneri]|uniref:LOW QUALITY PROTEIN: protein arginine N-methyltransferase 2-like n=1 Tax=Lethenteron reissneri TaxID=7753 RepID=UPI002AB6BA5E|nr:LOW QUALITY PROTEIN: protein arginine N-methyltransferase 2-like [Lethenteron reissneri]
MPREGVQRGREELGDDGVMEGTGDHGTFTAAADYKAADLTQLSFRRGDRIVVHQQMSNEWWWAELSGCFGYVPARYFTERDPLQDLGEEDTWQDDEYFNSYSKLKLQQEMLADRVRTETYGAVMKRSREWLRGKAVLDVGCGSGIISMLCAKHAQPSRVYAVEASELARLTEQVVRCNGMEDTVRVLQGRVEDVELPGSVDCLVSEWMGTCLLFEFMIESVLQARDRWLRDGGVMWPSTAALYLTPCSAQREYADKIGFWDWQYELDFSQLRTEAAKEFFSKPKHDHQMDPDDCLAEPCCILQLDMSKVQTSDLEEITYEFIFEVKKAGPMHGFAAWFSTEFKCPDSNPSIILDTGPMTTATHWKQTLFMLDSPVAVTPGDVVAGSVALRRNPVWRRHMSVAFRWRVAPSADAPDAIGEGEKTFPLWR